MEPERLAWPSIKLPRDLVQALLRVDIEIGALREVATVCGGVARRAMLDAVLKNGDPTSLMTELPQDHARFGRKLEFRAPSADAVMRCNRLRTIPYCRMV